MCSGCKLDLLCVDLYHHLVFKSCIFWIFRKLDRFLGCVLVDVNDVYVLMFLVGWYFG
jgi:hypothetical protein